MKKRLISILIIIAIFLLSGGLLFANTGWGKFIWYNCNDGMGTQSTGCQPSYEEAVKLVPEFCYIEKVGTCYYFDF